MTSPSEARQWPRTSLPMAVNGNNASPLPLYAWQRPKFDRDEAQLAIYGKKQVLKRRFGLVSIVGLTCTLMITWEASLIVMDYTLANGNPLWGCIFSFVGVFSQSLIMAQLGSMIPVAGGQYNWVSVLAPRSVSRPLSYITGWITLIAWQALTAGAVYLIGTILEAVIILNYPAYEPKRWETTLIFWAIIAVGVGVNSLMANLLPMIETIILLLHVLGFLAVLVPLLVNHKADASTVFGTFMQEGGWNKGLTFLVGINNSMFAFIGIDGATHMAEEITGAAEVVPWAMIASMGINGVTGFVMLLAALFCVTDLSVVLHGPTGFPILEIFKMAVGSAGGAVGLAVVLILTMIFATLSIIATSSRMLWAFAREQGVPGHKWISHVDRRTSLPLAAIGVTALVNILLALINIGSTAAFYAFTSMTISGFYVSYTISACVLLWRILAKQPIRYGSFRLGRFEMPVLLFSIAYSIIGTFFSFWPQDIHPTLESMNWASLIFGAVFIFSGLYWGLWARRFYIGPVIETTFEEYRQKTVL